MHLCFIINSKAVKQQHQTLIDALQKRLSAHTIDSFYTKHRGDARQIAKEITQHHDKDTVVVCCGGDGTVHEVANGLVNSNIPLLILPMGTGNDFSKKLYGKDFSLEGIISSYFTNDQLYYRTSTIDLIQVNDRYCINIMSFGFDTMVEKIAKNLAKRFPRLRKSSYNLAVVIALFRKKQFYLHFSLQDQHDKCVNYHSKFTLAAICNASYYGGGFCPAPNAKLNDGILEFCLADPMTGIEIALMADAYKKGKARNAKIHYHQIHSGTVHTINDELLPINCDGEHLATKKIDFRVLQNALVLALPKS